MDYIKWNDFIGDYFFGNEQNLGRTIYLYIDKNLFIDRFREIYFTDDRGDNEIWRDFVDAINYPIISTDSYGHHFDCPFSADEQSYKERLLKLVRWYNQNNYHNQSKYPIYLVFPSIKIPYPDNSLFSQEP